MVLTCISDASRPTPPAASTPPLAPRPSASASVASRYQRLERLPRPYAFPGRQPAPLRGPAVHKIAIRATLCIYSRISVEFGANSYFRAEGALSSSANTRYSCLKRECPVALRRGPSSGAACRAAPRCSPKPRASWWQSMNGDSHTGPMPAKKYCRPDRSRRVAWRTARLGTRLTFPERDGAISHGFTFGGCVFSGDPRGSPEMVLFSFIRQRLFIVLTCISDASRPTPLAASTPPLAPRVLASASVASRCQRLARPPCPNAPPVRGPCCAQDRHSSDFVHLFANVRRIWRKFLLSRRRRTFVQCQRSPQQAQTRMSRSAPSAASKRALRMSPRRPARLRPAQAHYQA